LGRVNGDLVHEFAVLGEFYKFACMIRVRIQLLGFTAFYREGFEVVLFLQSYRLKLGSLVVLYGVVVGALATGIVAILTVVAHRYLPYRRMLVSTGLMLAFVLLVMVGEEARDATGSMVARHPDSKTCASGPSVDGVVVLDIPDH
jgi:hypothetical protein